METKTIAFNDIIAFVKKAIDNNYTVITHKYNNNHYVFKVEHNTTKDNEISLLICNDHFWIDCVYSDGFARIEYNLTDRDNLIVEELYLTVKEYNEKRAINTFNNFFYKEDSEKEVVMNINSLNDDD